MIERCANPICSAPFRRLGRGKLFAFEGRTPANLFASGVRGGKTSAFFWLCDKCSLDHTLAIDAAGNVKVERISSVLPVREDGGWSDARIEEHV
jgi:hypothetical protein